MSGQQTSSPAALSAVTRLRLSVMMFGQFFVWGAWFVTLGTFLSQELDATGSQISLAALSQSIGAIVAPLIIGLIADRYFHAQRIMAVLHLAGGALLLLTPVVSGFAAVLTLLVLHMVLYMPTLALANTISFRQLSSPEQQFPSIRVLGTLGWIVAGLVIGWLGWEGQMSLERTFVMAGVAAMLLGLYCFTLPATPPRAQTAGGVGALFGASALTLLRDRSYLVFFCCSVAICIPLAFYYNFTNLFLNEVGVESAAAVQTLGQVSEFAFLLVMPLLLRRLGLKWTLAVGMAAWALRYVLFALGDGGELYALLIIGLVLHGVCYDFFFVAGQIYTEKKAAPGTTASAQGLISLATYGVGLLLGSLVSGPVVDAFVTADGHTWPQIWVVPAVIAAVVLVAFVVLFRERGSEVTAVQPSSVPTGGRR